MRRDRHAGFSVIELLTVVGLIGILAALAAPSLRGFIRARRVDTTLRQFAGDVAYARMLAVRSGTGAAIRYRATSACAPGGRATVGFHAYEVVLLTTPERTTKLVSVRAGGGSLCLEANRAAVQFNSRGIPSPPSTQTVWAREGTLRDSLTISALGRVLRRY